MPKLRNATNKPFWDYKSFLWSVEFGITCHFWQLTQSSTEWSVGNSILKRRKSCKDNQDHNHNLMINTSQSTSWCLCFRTLQFSNITWTGLVHRNRNYIQFKSRKITPKEYERNKLMRKTKTCKGNSILSMCSDIIINIKHFVFFSPLNAGLVLLLEQGFGKKVSFIGGDNGPSYLARYNSLMSWMIIESLTECGDINLWKVPAWF